MQKTLIDAGPLIALFDGSDAWHERVVDFLKSYRGALVTTWPVITEATHMLDFSVEAQTDLLTWIDQGGIELFDLHAGHLERLIALAKKYADLPMDLADGSLIVAAETLGTRDVLTIDSDYDIYRTLKKEAFRNVLRGLV